MRIRLSLIALTLIMGVLVSSCKKDPAPTQSEEDKQIEKLSGTWVVPNPAPANSVTIDGNDVTTDWSSFVLTLGNKTYQSTGADSPEVWPASGTWAFGTNVLTLVRDDLVEITVDVTAACLPILGLKPLINLSTNNNSSSVNSLSSEKPCTSCITVSLSNKKADGNAAL